MLRRMLTILIVTFLVLLSSPPVARAQSGEVRGVVYFDDGTGNRGLAGVEVFLGIQSTTFVSRYTCTDAFGYFAFADVPLDTDLIAAAGIEVEFAQRCSNPVLLAPAVPGHPRQPLLIQTWERHSGVLTYDPIRLTTTSLVRELKFILAPWPTGGDRPLNNTIIVGIQQFQRGQTARGVATFQFFKTVVDRYRSRGRLDAETATALNRYADVMIELFNLL